MVTDTIADMLTRIQNAIRVKKRELIVPNTKSIVAILSVLKKEEMIENYEIVDEGIEVKLKYDGKVSVIDNLKKMSKPGRRMYVTYKEITPVMNGRGISIISTSQGVMSGALAKSKKLGGELICHIW